MGIGVDVLFVVIRKSIILMGNDLGMLVNVEVLFEGVNNIFFLEEKYIKVY